MIRNYSPTCVLAAALLLIVGCGPAGSPGGAAKPGTPLASDPESVAKAHVLENSRGRTILKVSRDTKSEKETAKTGRKYLNVVYKTKDIHGAWVQFEDQIILSKKGKVMCWYNEQTQQSYDYDE